MSERPPEIVEHDSQSKDIVIDWERAELVLGSLLDAFEKHEFPYNQDSVRLPHDPRHLPESLPRDGKEYANFLWTVCYYMRGGIKSVAAVRALSEVYNQRPELFIPKIAMHEDPEKIALLLRESGLGYRYTQISEFWVENAKRMNERWDGDPRKIFDGVDTYEQAIERVKNDGNGGGFLGFQEKMVSMIIYYLMDEGLIDEYLFPLPVDLHVLRVTIANELVRFEGYQEVENLFSKELLQKVRDLYYGYAQRYNVSPLRLCDAVWLLSESLCGKQPGNVTYEPNGRTNRNGRSTVLVAPELDVNNAMQREAYARSCANCPAESTCRWNIPGKIYYVQGELKRRGKRLEYPVITQGSLFDLLES